MLQNRVDPMGSLIQTPARGEWMGNRGIIHNDHQEIVRPFKLHAWITCLLEFKGRWRPVMAPKRYTSLFFMDEATSFSAGHRPCAECRREDFNRFKMYWIKGNPEFGFNLKTPVRQIDEVLQRERIGKDKSKITYEEKPDRLPEGAFVLFDSSPYLLRKGQLFLWTPSGYKEPMALPAVNKLSVLTPRSVVNTFKAGYLIRP